MPASALTPPLVLTFAPSDPSGGSGIQADLLTCASMGCHALTVVTALTVQDSAGLEDAEPVAADWIDDQARSLLEDMPVRAFKIGGLLTAEAASAIAEVLADYASVPVVLHLGADPPGVTDAETEDSAEEALSAALELLVPQATLVVVDNLLAARLVADGLVELESDDDSAERALLRLGAGWVLGTGLHRGGDGRVVNTLLTAEPEADPVRYEWPRLAGNFRGAGATLSAAIAALLAGGMEVRDAVAEAQEYLWQALSAGFQPGMGRLLPDRFFWARQPAGDTGDTGEGGGSPAPDGIVPSPPSGGLPS
ncbi:hydroxymethylpyrimidine/phosphomethylpyrimidine kinase [Pigmentiphaga soli]|uniref:hydroxymethylpyrimidine kinase n=1 Tax=Pigmentiphaga soli TaxID=1007095 RepID=A0ABP8HPE2_9BURK